MNITENFTLEELTISQNAARAGISNTPGEAEQANLEWLCIKILEPIHKNKGKVIVNSGYRSPEVNKLIGGVATSQHCHGQAADIVVPNMSVEELFAWISSTELPFDQVIQEFGTWVHVSYSRDKTRRQLLRAVSKAGVTQYLPA